MTLAGYAPPPDNRVPALVAAAALHIALIAALWFFGRPSMVVPGSAVPINIVSSAPTTDSRPAEEAPQAQTAQTETPAPETKTPPPPPPPKAVAHPEPTPKPAPPKPAPTPAPKPAPVKAAPTPVPTPARPVPRPAQPQARQAFDFDSLQQTIDRAARSAPPRPSAAPRGPTRAETDTHARVDAGQGISQSELQGLQQLLGRLWNPNCQVEGGDGVKLKLGFSVTPDGRLNGAINAYGADHSGDPVVAAALRRAVDAIHQVVPYPAYARGQSIIVNFNAKEVCASR